MNTMDFASRLWILFRALILGALNELQEEYGEVTTRMVAVGTAVARRPPRRSVRAELLHTAPALGLGVKAFIWIWV